MKNRHAEWEVERASLDESSSEQRDHRGLAGVMAGSEPELTMDIPLLSEVRAARWYGPTRFCP